MIRNCASIALLGLALSACQTGTTGTASFAVDVNSDGKVDCADVDRVHMCLHFDLAAGDPLCKRADVSGDGVIDDEDIHGMFEGVTARGCDCEGPCQQSQDTVC